MISLFYRELGQETHPTIRSKLRFNDDYPVDLKVLAIYVYTWEVAVSARSGYEQAGKGVLSNFKESSFNSPWQKTKTKGIKPGEKTSNYIHMFRMWV